MRFLNLIIFLLIFSACKVKKEVTYQNFTENFSDKESLYKYWEDDSQNNSPKNYTFEYNHLKMISRANTNDRVKIKTKSYFSGYGSYTWRVYIPKMVIGEQCSIGAFLYFDDKHELDFEIGSGTKKIRNELQAKNDDLVVYCTSQGLPYRSTPFLLKNEYWYQLKIQISKGKHGNYLAKWYLNNKLLTTEQLSYKSKFYAFCSIENLSFIGDELPKYDNYTLFDWFKFIKD